MSEPTKKQKIAKDWLNVQRSRLVDELAQANCPWAEVDLDIVNYLLTLIESSGEKDSGQDEKEVECLQCHGIREFPHDDVPFRMMSCPTCLGKKPAPSPGPSAEEDDDPAKHDGEAEFYKNPPPPHLRLIPSAPAPLPAEVEEAK